MRYRLAVLAGALGLALPQPCLAQANASRAAMSPAQAEAHKAASDELAAIVLPDAQIEPQTDRMVEAMLTQYFEQDAEIREFEAVYPGMRDAVGAGMKPVLVKLAFKLQPSYRADLAALYRDNLSTAEARAAAAFFRSPAMAKFTAAARANMNYKATFADLDPDKAVSVADVQTDMRVAGVNSVKAVTPAEMTTIATFMTSPLGIKLRALNPQKLAIDTKWMNYTDPEAEKAVVVAVEQAMIGHIALSDPETAELMRQELAKSAE